MRLWTLVAEQARGGAATVEHVGAVSITASGVDAAAITVVLAASPRETLYTSDLVARDMEELTTTLGEGPGVDGLADGPALAGDLGDDAWQARWPVFAPAALDAGVHAAFALPLQVGGVHVGVMDLYRADAGALEPDQLADTLLLADTACALLLDAATAWTADRRPEGAALQHPEVHQATGMIIAQAGVSATVALIRLRAYAYANDQRLRDVAASVVARRLRFHPDAETVAGAGDA
ncbi:ANTAR domain-containing protein [Dactylosporangium vinaceum]|uniref:ANTAR domain-containing protein n=1 Tax=Dactylosporangium vinaceum TaxID=53362 RepID=A0ABV5MKV0_9ACTN|nr:ANTAR domain-containing protein [Dactylosporangium vinaceum]UAB93943.1 ANTAR domain-containing protein [Dactylosporangium vinaceum]